MASSIATRQRELNPALLVLFTCSPRPAQAYFRSVCQDKLISLPVRAAESMCNLTVRGLSAWLDMKAKVIDQLPKGGTGLTFSVQ